MSNYHSTTWRIALDLFPDTNPAQLSTAEKQIVLDYYYKFY